MLKNPAEGFAFETSDWIGPYALRAAFDRGFHAHKSDGWRSRADSLAALSPTLYHINDFWHQAVYETEDAICSISLNERARRVGIEVFADDFEVVKKVIAALKELLPESEEVQNRNIIPISFWTQAPTGPKSITRDIDVPSWSDIEINYNAVARSELDHLHNSFTPSKGGQLLLWHGAPGTGKTYAIRSIGQAWQDWCEFEYIVDPDHFFGDSAYMMSVLLDRQSSHINFDRIPTSVKEMLGITEEDVDDWDEDQEERQRKWRLFILEDCGELLMQDAKDRVGQGLSRLLNLVDGLIGQGLRILLLITTNEELGRMHPAVTRPGRAAENIPFGLLDADEAAAWAQAHDIPAPGGATTLAQLFSTSGGFHKPLKASSKGVGFRTNGAGHTPFAQIRRGEGRPL